MVTMNGDLTLVAQTKVNVSAPLAPTIVYGYHNCSCTKTLKFKENEMVNITGSYYGYLLTYDSDDGNLSYIYLKHRNSNGNANSQYPTNGNLFNISRGKIAYVTVNENSGSYDIYDCSSLTGLNSNVYNDWLKGYVKLYYALVDAKANLDADDTLDGSVYATALAKYKNATFGTTASEFNAQVTNLQSTYGITPITLNAALPPDLETEEFDSPDILANIFDPNDPDAADTAGATTDQPETTGNQPADDTQTTETTQATEPEQATEPTQATELEQPSEPEQTNEPDANAPASAGLTSGAEGHWAGSTDYANVGNTNYQLKTIAGGKSVLRKTMDGSNTFNLVAGQSANFSNQFSRGSLFRIAQTGSSWYFDEPETDNTATVDDAEGYYTGSQGNLSKRYKTGWRISDDAATPNQTAGVCVYGYSVFNTNNNSPLNHWSNVDVSMNYLTDDASSYDMVHLTVNFYNEVRVGDVKVSKDLTDEAKAVDGYEDKEFTFKVTFSEIFGDENSDKFNFAGQSVVIYETAHPSNTRNVTIGADGTFKMKYGEYVMFKNIPVYTKYTIQETQPDGSDKGVVWTVNRVYTYHAYKDASNKQTFAGDIAVTANTAGTTEVDTTAKIPMNQFVLDNNADSTDTGAVSTYSLTTTNMLSRYTGYKLDNDVEVTSFNSTVTIEGNEYNNAAQVTFVNHKDADNRNVEGNVSVVQNQITIEKGEDLDNH